MEKISTHEKYLKRLYLDIVADYLGLAKICEVDDEHLKKDESLLRMVPDLIRGVFNPTQAFMEKYGVPKGQANLARSRVVLAEYLENLETRLSYRLNRTLSRERRRLEAEGANRLEIQAGLERFVREKGLEKEVDSHVLHGVHILVEKVK